MGINRLEAEPVAIHHACVKGIVLNSLNKPYTLNPLFGSILSKLSDNSLLIPVPTIHVSNTNQWAHSYIKYTLRLWGSPRGTGKQLVIYDMSVRPRMTCPYELSGNVSVFLGTCGWGGEQVNAVQKSFNIILSADISLMRPAIRAKTNNRPINIAHHGILIDRNIEHFDITIINFTVSAMFIPEPPPPPCPTPFSIPTSRCY